jgi:hypothetical protein
LKKEGEYGQRFSKIRGHWVYGIGLIDDDSERGIGARREFDDVEGVMLRRLKANDMQICRSTFHTEND